MNPTYHDFLTEDPRHPGILRFGGARMAILDVEAGFWGLRRQMEALVGSRLTDAVFQQAGANGGASFARAFAPNVPPQAAAQALRDCIAAYQAAGFGRFQIEVLEWPFGHVQGEPFGRVVVRAWDTFEAWMARQHGRRAEHPVCAYSAGVLVGFVNVLAGRNDVVCIQRACQAQGADSCLFELLPAEAASDVPVVTFAPDPALGRQLNLLEILFDRMPVGIAIFDRDLRLRRCNPTWAEFIDRYTPSTTRQVVPGAYFFDLAPGTEEEATPIFERVLAGETVRVDGLRLESGGIASYWDVVFAPLVEDGEVVGFVDVTTDATERVLAYQELEERVEARTRELSTLLEVVRAASGSLELKEVLRRVAQGLASAVGVRHCGIYLVDEGSGLLLPAEGADPGSLEEAVRQASARQPLDPSRDLFTRQVLESQEPVVCYDAEADPRTDKEVVRLLGLKSILAVPFVVKDRVVAVAMLATFDVPYKFTKEQIELAQGIASTVALTVENARLYRAEQERLAEVERRRQVAEGLRDILTILNSNRPLDEILDHIVAQAVRLLSPDAVAIYRLQEDGLLSVQASQGLDTDYIAMKIPIGRGTTGRAVQERRSVAETIAGPLRLSNAHIARMGKQWQEHLERLTRRYRALLSVPLVVKDQVYGAITLYYREPHEFSNEEVGLAVAFADQAALAIENARLHQVEQERRRELQTLLDVAAAAGSSLNLDEMLTQTLDRLVSLVGASRVGVMLLDSDTGELKPRMIRPERSVAPEDMAEMVEACRAVIDGGEPLYVPVDERLGHLEPGALLPLRARGQAQGVLVIIGPEGGSFSRGQMALFESIADQLGVAVENARLYEQAEQAAAAAERSRLARDLHDAVTQTLFSASLIAEVLPRIWEQDPEEGRHRLEELRQLTRGALAEMRTLLLELRPSALAEAKLSDLLRQLAESITGRARVLVAVEVEGECDLPPEVKIALYRIAQEALNNVAKHAGASRVEVRLRCEPGRVSLCICDDGRGFDPKSVLPESLGLGIMRERAEAVGATLTVESGAGEGTRVVVVWAERGT
ncbi:MAG TPA: GAF domain-containing protein [Thermoflexia bacterium]|nr:GAF domain-containing protein [Thermoflexia bacterium]